MSFIVLASTDDSCLSQLLLRWLPVILWFIMLSNSGLTACCSKANTQERSVDWEGEVALFRRLANWGEDWLLSKHELQRFCFKWNFLKGESFGEGVRVVPLWANFLLIGWWWGDMTVLQESCAQPEVTVLHVGGDLSFCWTIQETFTYILWGRTRTLPQGCTIVSWLFLSCVCIPSLTW